MTRKTRPTPIPTFKAARAERQRPTVIGPQAWREMDAEDRAAAVVLSEHFTRS